jgi:hypothetical protein
VRFGNLVQSIQRPATATITGGSGTAFVYVNRSGQVVVGHSITVNCSSGCQAESGITNFPYDVIPIATWGASTGVWNAQGSDWRAWLSTNILNAGEGIITVDAGRTTTVAVDRAAVPTYLTGSATLDSPSMQTGACAADMTISVPGAAGGQRGSSKLAINAAGRCDRNDVCQRNRNGFGPAMQPVRDTGGSGRGFVCGDNHSELLIMKSITIGFIMLGAALLSGQTIVHGLQIAGGTTLPATCVSGQIVFNSAAAPGQNLYICQPANTWTQISGVTSGAAQTGQSNTYAAGTTQAFKGTLDASSATATLRVTTGGTLPGNCSTGQLFLRSGADPSRMLYICATTNNWSQAGYAQGTIAQMPSSCIAGQIYFATDATPAGQNLYFCTAANTWTQAAGGSAQVNADWDASSGVAQILNKPTVTTTTAANAVVQRDASADIYGSNLWASGQVLATYGMSWGTRLYQGSIESPNCSTGTLTLSGETALHKGLLSNQASCSVALANPTYTGMLQMIVLRNGGTTATATKRRGPRPSKEGLAPAAR